MATRGRPKKTNGSNGGANLGFEATMWMSADELRGQVDAAEYKHVVLGTRKRRMSSADRQRRGRFCFLLGF